MNANQPAYPQHGWSSDPETVARMQSVQGLTKRELIAATIQIETDLLGDVPISCVESFAGPRPSGDWKTNTVEWFKWNARLEAAIRVIKADALLAKLQETEVKP